jgi:FAD-linked sulfhydryl oxidase
MPSPPATPRRKVILIIAVSAILSILFVTSFRGHPHPSPRNPISSSRFNDEISEGTLVGHAIAPKLGNETLKAELGRASWKLFHTVMARFPDTPSADEKSALKSYIHLFQRLYPCGECAEHFGQILAKFPPQVSTRSTAAAWACHVHNEVNKSLGKELFDCANIGDFYDCGCAEDEKEGMNEAGKKKVERERSVGHEVMHNRHHSKAEG